jgi:hypothetical protein
MSTQARALIIALIGPAVSTLGILWVIVNVTVDRGRDLTLRYVLFDPGHLIIAVGIALSVVCIPLAFQVAAAKEEELELELFEPDPAKQVEPPREAPEPGWIEATEWE